MEWAPLTLFFKLGGRFSVLCFFRSFYGFVIFRKLVVGGSAFSTSFHSTTHFHFFISFFNLFPLPLTLLAFLAPGRCWRHVKVLSFFSSGRAITGHLVMLGHIFCRLRGQWSLVKCFVGDITLDRTSAFPKRLIFTWLGAGIITGLPALSLLPGGL